MCHSYSDLNFGITFLEHNVYMTGLSQLLVLRCGMCCHLFLCLLDNYVHFQWHICLGLWHIVMAE